MIIRPNPLDVTDYTLTLQPGDRVALVDAATHERLTDIVTIPASGTYTWFSDEIRSDRKRRVTWVWKDEKDTSYAYGYPNVMTLSPGDTFQLHQGKPPALESERVAPAIDPIHPFYTFLVILGLCAVGWTIFSILIFLVQLMLRNV